MAKGRFREVHVSAGDVSLCVAVGPGEDVLKVARGLARLASGLLADLPASSAESADSQEAVQFGFAPDRAVEFSDSRFDYATADPEDTKRDI